MSSPLNVTEQGSHQGDTDSQVSVHSLLHFLWNLFSDFSFFVFFFQIFLTHPAYEGKPQCQIIAKNFFGRNCLGREISKEIGKLPGDQKEDRSSGSMKE